jgi:hypothetical protein
MTLDGSAQALAVDQLERDCLPDSFEGGFDLAGKAVARAAGGTARGIDDYGQGRPGGHGAQTEPAPRRFLTRGAR